MRLSHGWVPVLNDSRYIEHWSIREALLYDEANTMVKGIDKNTSKQHEYL